MEQGNIITSMWQVIIWNTFIDATPGPYIMRSFWKFLQSRRYTTLHSSHFLRIGLLYRMSVTILRHVDDRFFDRREYDKALRFAADDTNTYRHPRSIARTCKFSISMLSVALLVRFSLESFSVLKQ